jgi:hypothetical protein
MKSKVATLWAQLHYFPQCTWAGFAGVTVGVFCAAVAGIRGVEIPPEGNLLDTATFNIALGIFILTLSALAPGVSWSKRGQRRWSRMLVVFTLYSYGIETVQAFRGLDPRFSRVAGPIDQAAGGIFFLVALSVLACFVILVMKYFRVDGTPLVLAVRYGAIASMIAFGVGIWMSVVTQGRTVPAAGNLLVAHAFGFHGLQAVPIVAFLIQQSKMPQSSMRSLVHWAGLAWVSVCVALAFQSGSGHAIFDLTPAAITAALCLMIFVITAAKATWGVVTEHQN